jgi:hypothetical protein
MHFLFRAVVGFAIAFAVYDPHGFAARFETLANVKTQLAAARPAEKLRALAADEIHQFRGKL